MVGFDHRLSVFAHRLQPVDQKTLVAARRFVDGLSADGNTDLEAALHSGLEILGHSEQRDASQMIVFLTDGLPTAGVTDEGLIARLVAQANAQQESRLHVFGVGYDVNTHLLDRLAADNGGTVTYVQPGEDLEVVLTSFYERIAHPVLTDVDVEFEGLEVNDLYPQQMPDMFRGSSLLLTGRHQATGPIVTVRVRGQAAGEEREYLYHFDLDQTGEYDFVPRLWATRRVGELLDRVRTEGESRLLVDEVQELGLSYGLVTPYTTFVIQSQADGPASAANMALYGNLAELNQAWGQTTVQARVQNQLYQQAAQASLAGGANVANYGRHNLAQVADQNIDLSLLQTAPKPSLDLPITAEWIEQNIGVDRTVAFGSGEYFALAENPAVRPLLQSGPNVIFAYDGQVISVQDSAESREDQGLSRPNFNWILLQGQYLIR
jgi:Ca-activated chloride channel family protein